MLSCHGADLFEDFPPLLVEQLVAVVRVKIVASVVRLQVAVVRVKIVARAVVQVAVESVQQVVLRMVAVTQIVVRRLVEVVRLETMTVR
jgi:hypothetical protein